MSKIIFKTGIRMLFASSILMNAYGQQSGQLTSDKGFKGKIGRTVAESQEYHPEKKKAPAGAPNVVVFLIDDAGYGEYFGHGLGHSLGLNIHEDPRLSPANTHTLLQENMVVTVEPGIYLPEWGGVRIEDTVLVKADGCEILTASSKQLIEI